MRLSSILTLGCAITAFVLSLLCLLAGTSKSFLQDADLMTLNISRIGHTSLFNTTDGDGGLFDSLVNDIQDDINDLLNDATSDIAEALDLPDFFNVHLMNFCQGSYAPNATAEDPHQNITECSNSSLSFHFEPTKTVEEHLPDGITLEDIHWPDEIRDAENAVKVASMATIVFYIIGTACAGIGMFTAVWGVLNERRLTALINVGIDVLAFLAIGIGSAISTAIVVKAVDAINKYGDDIGIAAEMGDKFLGMTWAATGLMLLAATVSLVQFCAGRRRSQQYGEKGGY
ncbi:uncharacterized protein Z518_01058 [Rhinocladiella mackenziei CBS 650.93]|uniref:Actin cortical patch SUR7/pH-response regulator PalI n=1 Tax=Rhinocladiella mackenziei CBS 650.93 TaxID=1442369 RepID=A0A0D2G5B9_9EURO|nr:uncharacterized protein Z518_01058 [Rhinocladiella mackenziei CBS 650.93]KIX09977.1 hypothetical protein Z518_01058 [Rhinocladiella mackenziei CBS 650.93]